MLLASEVDNKYEQSICISIQLSQTWSHPKSTNNPSNVSEHSNNPEIMSRNLFSRFR